VCVWSLPPGRAGSSVQTRPQTQLLTVLYYVLIFCISLSLSLPLSLSCLSIFVLSVNEMVATLVLSAHVIDVVMLLRWPMLNLWIGKYIVLSLELFELSLSLTHTHIHIYAYQCAVGEGVDDFWMCRCLHGDLVQSCELTS
jgi:hypothetical protein